MALCWGEGEVGGCEIGFFFFFFLLLSVRLLMISPFNFRWNVMFPKSTSTKQTKLSPLLPICMMVPPTRLMIVLERWSMLFFLLWKSNKYGFSKKEEKNKSKKLHHKFPSKKQNHKIKYLYRLVHI